MQAQGLEIAGKGRLEAGRGAGPQVVGRGRVHAGMKQALQES